VVSTMHHLIVRFELYSSILRITAVKVPLIQKYFNTSDFCAGHLLTVALGHTRTYGKRDTIFFWLCAAHVTQNLQHCKLGDNLLRAILFMKVCSIPCNVSVYTKTSMLYTRTSMFVFEVPPPNLAFDMYPFRYTVDHDHSIHGCLPCFIC
jgi:hypothetical protein